MCRPFPVFPLTSFVVNTSSPIKVLISVDFPAPDGPETTTDFSFMYCFNSESPVFVSVEIGKMEIASLKIFLNLLKKSSSSSCEAKSILDKISTTGIF